MPFLAIATGPRPEAGERYGHARGFIAISAVYMPIAIILSTAIILALLTFTLAVLMKKEPADQT